MGHDRRVLDERLDAAQRLGEREDADALEHRAGLIEAVFEVDRHHAAKVAHLLLGDIVLRVALQARVDHPLDRRVLAQVPSHALGVDAVALHADVQCLRRTQEQEALHDARHGSF